MLSDYYDTAKSVWRTTKRMSWLSWVKHFKENGAFNAVEDRKDTHTFPQTPLTL